MIKIGKDISNWGSYSCRPKTKKELEQIIIERIAKEGHNCNLNDIDVSLIDDMSYIFSFNDFNGDISKWNVSNVKNMNGMFNYATYFNGDISGWDTSKVENMNNLFKESAFNRDISRWNVSNVKEMSLMFASSKFNKSIANWNVSKVENMKGMFFDTDFNQDISNWKISKACDTYNMFKECTIKETNKPKSLQS